MCRVTDVLMFELPRTIDAPASARRLVEEHLCPAHGRDALAAAQLLATEVATCAVLYGKPPITLELECHVTRLLLSVTHRTDRSDVEDIPIDEEGGLRSALLDKLSRSWGVQRTLASRTLWTALPTGVLPDRNGHGTAARPGPPV
jgi:hypothetical protein